MHHRSIIPPSTALLLSQTLARNRETNHLFTIKISELPTENLVTKSLPYQHYSCPMHLRGHPDRICPFTGLSAAASEAKSSMVSTDSLRSLCPHLSMHSHFP